MCDVAVYTEKIDWGERSSPEADWFVEQRFVQQISTAFQCQKGTGKNYISSLWGMCLYCFTFSSTCSQDRNESKSTYTCIWENEQMINYPVTVKNQFYGHTFHVFLCCLYLVCQKFGSSKSFGGTVRWKPTLAKHCGDYEEH